jgi:DNA gyrase/topoisomerase IV subunit A
VNQISVELDTAIEQGMSTFAKASFIDRYSDARDGLKPVLRKILFAMSRLGLTHRSSTMKCAKIVGLTIGDFHPHGDAGTYDALVNAAAEFNANYPVIHGQGNFGSLLGDGAAAYRYTEARFSEYGYRCLMQDLNEETVEFSSTFDNQDMEPTVLPAALPNLIINGSYSIAGAAFNSSIPPHNLAEVIDLTIDLIQNPDLSNDDIGGRILPDFPFDSIIINPAEITEFYKNGTPTSIKMITQYSIDREKREIHITGLPYLVDGNSLKTEINKKFPKLKDIGIDDIIPNCTTDSLDFIIVYTKNANPDKLVQLLMSRTRMSNSAQLIFTCTINGKLMENCTLKDIFVEWIRFRREVVRKVIMHRIQKIYRETHILEALVSSFEKLDDIIAMIRKAPSKDHIIHTLIHTYKFTILQANAIASMKLYDISKSSKQELIEKHILLTNEMTALRKKLHPSAIDMDIINQLLEFKAKFGRPRRTQLLYDHSNNSDAAHDHEYILAKISDTNDIGIIRLDAALSDGNHAMKILGRNRVIQKVYKYNPQRDYLFAISNLGIIYKLQNVIDYLNMTTLDTVSWRALQIDLSPRIGESLADFVVMPKADFENGIGHVIIYASDHTIRKISIPIIPQRLSKNGYQLIKLKDATTTIIGAHYISSKNGSFIGYGTEFGQVHVYPLSNLPEGTRLAGSMKISSSSSHILQPSVFDIEGMYYIALVGGTIVTGDVKNIPQRRAGVTPVGLHTVGRKQPDSHVVRFGGFSRNGILCVAPDGNISKNGSKNGTCAVIEL